MTKVVKSLSGITIRRLIWLMLALPLYGIAQPTVNLDNLQPGQLTTVQWLGLPVLVYKRTPGQIDQLRTDDAFDAVSYLHKTDAYYLFARTYGADLAARLKPSSDALESSPFRSIQPDILVVLGISTRFGCYIDQQQDDQMLSDTCSGAQYSLDGRISQINSRERFHLLIPPHEIVNGTLTLIEQKPEAQLIRQFIPDFSQLNLSSGALLMEYLQWNQFDLAEEQLSATNVLNFRTQTNATALHLAAMKAPTVLLEKMLNLGFDPNATTTEGTTPLKLALLKTRLDNAQLLISRGAKASSEQVAFIEAQH